jgi:LuxR family maltose regulon positive regulatory protein
VLILTGQLEAGESSLAEAERAAQDADGGEGATGLLTDIASARAFIARLRGDDERTIELSERALSQMPPGDAAGRSVLAVNLGMAHWSSGHLTEAEQALKDAEQAARESGNHYARLTALSFLGAVYGAQGRLHKAAERLRQAIEAGAGSPPTALAYDTLGAVLYEWNELESAEEHLERGVDLGARTGNVEIRTGGYRILARLRQGRGDSSGALEALDQAHQLAREKYVAPLVRARNAACHAQISLAQGDLTTASRWAERVTQPADGSLFYPLLGLTPARMLLAQGEKAAAAEQLKGWHEVAVGAGWQFGVIETRALQALAAPTVDEALACLADGLALAEPEGYVRTFVDKGEPMAELVRKAAGRGLAPGYARRLLKAFTDSPIPGIPVGQLLIEPLSERELEVVARLAEGLTYREIAQVLFVSLNTVKTHLKSIYGKLGVHDRREAVARAEELDLVS